MVTVKDRVFSEPAPGLPPPTSIGFLILHVLGGAYALYVLNDAWATRPWHIIPVGLALVTLLAAVQTGRTVWCWQQCRPERDLPLRWRVHQAEGRSGTGLR